MQWGAAQKKWAELIETGQKLPPQYYEQPDEPELAVHLISVWSEFFDLSTERQIGMAVGPIPASKIRERAYELDIDDEDDAARFFTLIRKLDDAFRADRPKTDDANAMVAPSDLLGTKRMIKSISVRRPTRQKKP